MFILSMKANKKNILFTVVCFLIVLSSIVLLVNGKNVSNANKKNAASVIAETNVQRIAYINSFGWQVSEEACEIVEVAIPQEFNDVYDKYNNIQKEQGFDLSKFKGKRVKRYSYEITNYPNEPDNIRVNMLIYNNQVIAGDVCSLKLNGFMHGFKKPAK